MRLLFTTSYCNIKIRMKPICWLLDDNLICSVTSDHSGVAGGVRCDDSLSGLGSRRSLADTSVTSTADLSVFSSGRSHAPDNSLDTHSNVSDDGTGSDG